MERYIRTSTAGIARELDAIELPPEPMGAATTAIGAAFGRVCSAFTYDKDQTEAYDLLLTLIRVSIDTIGLGVGAAMELVEAGRLRAHAKHGDNSIEAKRGDETLFWLSCLGEEFGEACEATTFPEYQGEVVDIITVATAWAAALDRPE